MPIEPLPPSSREREYVCFGPHATILLSNGKRIPVSQIRVGMTVLTGFGSKAVVSCIWKYLASCFCKN